MDTALKWPETILIPQVDQGNEDRLDFHASRNKNLKNI